MKFLILIVLVAQAHSSFAQNCRQQFPKVDHDIGIAELEISKMNESFDKVPGDANDPIWVKSKLQHMFDVDQYIRNIVRTIYQRGYTQSEMQCATSEILSRMMVIDAQNTLDMKGLLSIYGWITISKFGETADGQAWIIVQHADQDPLFQKSVLDVLEKLWPIKETNSKNYAYLFDRVAASWSDPAKRFPQRYGTQGKCKAPGDWEPLPIEDEAHLDERRSVVGLQPFADYKKIADTMCH